MKRNALVQWFVSAVAFFVLALASGCREERNSPEKSGEAPAPAVQPAADQGAPIPEGGAVEILRLGPSGPMKRLTQITAMFNQPMVALGDYDNVPEGIMKIEPPLDGGFKWLNQYTLAFIPTEPLLGSHEITAEIPAGIAALSGVTLAEGRSIDIALPKLNLTDSFPPDGPVLDAETALHPSRAIIFNQKPELESLKSRAFFMYRDGGGDVKTAAEVRERKGGDRLDSGRSEPVYVFTATEKLPRNTEFQLILEEGAKSQAGPLPSERLTLWAGATYGPLTASLRISPGDDPLDPAYGVYVSFSNPVKASEAAEAISLDNGYDTAALKKHHAREETPDLREGEEDVEAYQTTLYIPGGFKPETRYTVTVDQGLSDVFGQKIAAAGPLTFVTGQYEPFARLDENFGLMETATEAKTRLVVSNLERVRVRGYALTAAEAARFLSRVSYDYVDPDKSAELLRDKTPATLEIAPPDGAGNGPTVMPVDLREMFGDKLTGHVLFLQSSWPDERLENRTQSTHAFVQISDIGLAVKTAPDGGLIWVNNLSSGRAWPEVELQVLSLKGQAIWSGRSDANGLARLPGSVELLKNSGGDGNLFIAAKAGDQLSLWNINWDDGLETWRWNLSTGSALAAADEKRHWLLNALPLYKPGETAEFKVIAREKNGDRLEDMSGRKMRLTVSDSQGRVIEDTAVETGAYGSFSHKLAIPEDAGLGHWGVSLGPEGASGADMEYVGAFMVETYRAPAFEIQVGPLPRKAVAGDRAELSIEANYHFGAPVSDRPAGYSVTASPAYGFSLPGLSEYSFVNHFSGADEYDDSGEGYQEPNLTVASDDASVDGDGRLKFALDLTPAPGRGPRPRDYSAYFTVTDVDQRKISTHASFLVHPAEVYVGLAADQFLGTAGQTYTIKAVAVDLDGRLLTGKKIKATLYRRVWQNVRRRTPGSGYEYVSRAVDEEAGSLEAVSGSVPAFLEFLPDKPGVYWVRAEIEDDKGRPNQSALSFYVIGDGAVGWRMENDDRLTLVADKKEYKPGEVARIMVQSPFSEGQGLLTVERGGVREARVFTIENQTPTLEVPITENDVPNVFVSVLLARGRIADRPDEKGADLGKPAIRLGYTELKIPSARDLLTVEVTPAQKEVGPGDEVEVNVAVKDDQGRPFSQAEVALIAADAAVLQLAGDETYYPDRFFMADEALRVLTADNLTSLVGRRNWGRKGGNPGGGGGEFAMAMRSADEADVRRVFASLAAFLPNLTLDQDGRAKAVIKMPENLSTFTLYAVASGHGRKGGTGRSSVLVTRDLLVRSALPGYAGTGDSFAAAMVVSNRGQNAGQAKVALSGDNFTLEPAETAEKTVPVGPGESREVAFKVRTGQSGRARFLFRLTMGEDSDAAEYLIDVIPPNRAVTQASYEQLTPGEKRVALALPPGSDPDRGGLELELSPSLLGVLSEPFQWLEEYPHACIEQQASKAWGRLLWLDIKDRLESGGDAKKEAQARQEVEEFLQRLSQWENGGGFSLWPGYYDWQGRSVYLTAYIMEFVLSARQAGFAPPYDGFEDRLAGFLEEALKADFNWPSWYSEAAVRDSRGYALAALSRAGRNVASYIENIYQTRETLDLTGLVNLIRAVAWQPKGNGRAGQLRELLALLNKHMTVTAGEAQFADNDPGAPELWGTPVRNTARVLETLCLAAPHNSLVPALVRNLMTEAKSWSGHFGGTQSNVAALSALAAYVKTLEPEDPDLAVEALLGETALLEAAFKSFKDAPQTASRPLAAIAATADPAVTYQVAGRGQAWASLKLKAAPAAPDLSADGSGGFMLSRSFTIIKPDSGARTGAEQFSRGDIVRVTVTMMAPVPRYSVVLEDRVPAGFEPINFNLGDADLSLMGLTNPDEEGDEYGHTQQRYWYNHQEIRPDRVNVYADYLRPGVYTYSYLAQAVTPGTYITPGPTAEEMYSPETHGRAQGQTLTVRE